MHYQGKLIDFKYQTNFNTNLETSFKYYTNITEPIVFYYNKDFFYKKDIVFKLLMMILKII